MPLLDEQSKKNVEIQLSLRRMANYKQATKRF